MERMAIGRKVSKSPTMKRKSKPIPLSERISLERVLGLTVSNNSSFDIDSSTGTVAYPAGCVIVLYNPRTNTQSHIFNASKKTITCLSFSADGRYLVVGESGHLPAVRVYDVVEKAQVAEFLSHKFAINCVSFAPNMRTIVSIGSQHDMMVNVWNWRASCKIASNKVACKVVGLAFSADSSVFVTVGHRHVKFWYLNACKSRLNETVPLLGHSGILGDQKNNFFCAVSFGKGDYQSTVYSITQSGCLCQFNAKRILNKWVDLRAPGAFSVSCDSRLIVVGCSNGVCLIFGCGSLNFIAQLPRPHSLGVDVSSAVSSSQLSSSRYPDAIAVRYASNIRQVACIYNDHSLYFWDVSDLKKIGKSQSFLYHSACIWGIEICESSSCFPNGTFVTCASDRTVRFWNLHCSPSQDNRYGSNVYSDELIKIFYQDSEDLQSLMNIDSNPGGKTDKTDTSHLDKLGVRSLKVSPDGRHLAIGDRLGNIKVYDLSNNEELCTLEAHNSEVLCLEFTPTYGKFMLMASASRDRLIHVFDVNASYSQIQTLDDHSSAITAVRFTVQEGMLHMLSCGADKSILFRIAQVEGNTLQFVLQRHLVGKTTLYDMDIDTSERFVAAACQDRAVRIYNINNGKQKKCYKGSANEDGTLIRIQIDPTGTVMATSCSDKNLAVVDFYSGEMLATMFGHSELITGIKFSHNLRYLISVSGDGCIFVWRLPAKLVQMMRLRQMTQSRSEDDILTDDTSVSKQDEHHEEEKKGLNLNRELSNGAVVGSSSGVIAANQNLSPKLEAAKMENLADESPKWKFSLSRLPGWAKKRLVGEGGTDSPSRNSPAAPVGPRGKWAHSAGNGTFVKSMLEENSAIQLSLASNLNNPGQSPLITNDDENNRDEDDGSFVSPFTLEEFVSSDGDGDAKPVIDKISASCWDTSVLNRHKFMEEEEEEEEKQESPEKDLVYFPPDETDCSDLESSASAFRVFAGGASSRDADSEDPGSLESYEDDDDDGDDNDDDDTSEPPTPTTPDIARLTEGELSLFHSNYETLDLDSPEALPQDLPRLSLSSRFLYRTQSAGQGASPVWSNRGRKLPPSAPLKSAVDGSPFQPGARSKSRSREHLSQSPGTSLEKESTEALSRGWRSMFDMSGRTKYRGTVAERYVTTTDINLDGAQNFDAPSDNNTLPRRRKSYMTSTESSRGKLTRSSIIAEVDKGGVVGAKKFSTFNVSKAKFKSTPNLLEVNDSDSDAIEAVPRRKLPQPPDDFDVTSQTSRSSSRSPSGTLSYRPKDADLSLIETKDMLRSGKPLASSNLSIPRRKGSEGVSATPAKLTPPDFSTKTEPVALVAGHESAARQSVEEKDERWKGSSQSKSHPHLDDLPTKDSISDVPSSFSSKVKDWQNNNQTKLSGDVISQPWKNNESLRSSSKTGCTISRSSLRLEISQGEVDIGPSEGSPTHISPPKSLSGPSGRENARIWLRSSRKSAENETGAALPTASPQREVPRAVKSTSLQEVLKSPNKPTITILNSSQAGKANTSSIQSLEIAGSCSPKPTSTLFGSSNSASKVAKTQSHERKVLVQPPSTNVTQPRIGFNEGHVKSPSASIASHHFSESSPDHASTITESVLKDTSPMSSISRSSAISSPDQLPGKSYSAERGLSSSLQSEGGPQFVMNSPQKNPAESSVTQVAAQPMRNSPQSTAAQDKVVAQAEIGDEKEEVDNEKPIGKEKIKVINDLRRSVDGAVSMFEQLKCSKEQSPVEVALLKEALVETRQKIDLCDIHSKDNIPCSQLDGYSTYIADKVFQLLIEKVNNMETTQL